MGTLRSSHGSLLGGRGLRLDLLQKVTRKPRLYTGRSLEFWTDPYVSRHVLEAHLDPHTDDASRRPKHIAGTVQKILEHAASAAGRDTPRLLDLACGPGLYAEQFAARGWRVTGIDFSDVSIGHARTSAAKQGLEIDYRREDILEARLSGRYDVVTLIYGEFCTFSERERRALLAKIRDALRPGGLLAFDVFTDAYVRRNRSSPDWYVSSRDGFWQKEPHLLLLEHFTYPADSASVACYTIIGEDGGYRQFNVWWRSFTADGITAFLTEAGFEVESMYGNLWGEPYDARDEWIGVFARVPAT